MTGKVRIISGQWRRRILRVADVEGLRPTPDRVRETLFNWLAGSIEDARCLDLYAGSGALGFEAASRGAAKVVMVERDNHAVDCMRRQASELGAEQIEVVHADARRWLHGEASTFDIVFLDPPFGGDDLGEVCERLDQASWLSLGALIYLESQVAADPLQLPSTWQIVRRQKAGQVRYHLAAAGSANRHLR